MKQVQVVVRDDDGISVEDGLRAHLPMIHSEESATLVAFSEGTVLRVAKDEADGVEGPWRITRTHQGLAVYTRTEAIEKDGVWQHSDRVVLAAGDERIRWVAIAEAEYFADDASAAAPAATAEDDEEGQPK